jgi:hypothetical protein
MAAAVNLSFSREILGPAFPAAQRAKLGAAKRVPGRVQLMAKSEIRLVGS